MNRILQLIGAVSLAVCATLFIQSAVQAEESEASSTLSDECMIGEVRIFAGNFAPRNYALCQGQLIAIAQHQALFSILGTTYGGDGRTTFALPDLRGRAPLQAGTGPGLPSINLGEKKGTPSIKTTTVEGVNPVRKGTYNIPSMGQPDNYQPSLGINYVICMQGIYPSRN